MATTYSPATAFTNPVHWIRLQLGDRGDGGLWILDDDEIAGAVAAMGIRGALIHSIDAAIAILTVQRPTMTVSGPFTTMYTDRLKALQMLRARVNSISIPPTLESVSMVSGPSVAPMNEPDFTGSPLIPTNPRGHLNN